MTKEAFKPYTPENEEKAESLAPPVFTAEEWRERIIALLLRQAPYLIQEQLIRQTDDELLQNLVRTAVTITMPSQDTATINRNLEPYPNLPSTPRYPRDYTIDYTLNRPVDYRIWTSSGTSSQDQPIMDTYGHIRG